MPETYKPEVSIKDGRPTLNTDQQGVSPTGRPIIPPFLVPYALAAVCAAEVVKEEVSNPAPWDAARALGLGIRLVTYCVLGSLPGWRK